MADTNKLWLGNLFHGLSGDALRAWIEFDLKCGGVASVRMFHKQSSASSAIVEFTSPLRAGHALELIAQAPAQENGMTVEARYASFGARHKSHVESLTADIIAGLQHMPGKASSSGGPSTSSHQLDLHARQTELSRRQDALRAAMIALGPCGAGQGLDVPPWRKRQRRTDDAATH